jgi:predicted SAM-dependent methyltransferase
MTKAMTRVNLGCGLSPTVGWKNYDNSFSIRLAQAPLLEKILTRLGFIGRPNVEFIEFARKNEIEYADVSRRIPLPDNSVDVVYSCHMLEHLDRQDALTFLKEARRALRPGGTLRIAVPDLSLKVAAYIAQKDADAFVESTLMCQPRPRTLVERVRFFFTGPRHHNWMYDGSSLSRLLSENGFVGLTVVPAGVTTIADPGNLNLFERSNESVYVEARRGETP